MDAELHLAKIREVFVREQNYYNQERMRGNLTKDYGEHGALMLGIIAKDCGIEIPPSIYPAEPTP